MGFFDFLSKKKDSGEAPGAGPDFSGVDAEKAAELEIGRASCRERV